MVYPTYMQMSTLQAICTKYHENVINNKIKKLNTKTQVVVYKYPNTEVIFN